MREDLYKVFSAYVKSARADKTFQKLDKEAQRYVNKTLEDFETQGMKLPLEKRQELIALQKEISELESKAEMNINEDKSKMEFKKEELKGLPDDIIEKLEQVPHKQGYVFLELGKSQGPPAMRQLENEETRKKLNLAMDNIC